ncbi:hypothetical protein [Isoptericola halotolerans]|uniref:Uncharacterized protein n=1 Tax=Isoptericola halotolerans TaxID=300560 RepID=A0ABX2A524_9MICO|nr:hypothetical protein [Isoptericola halotolerans]NOV97957.1 hypothetical protein [Isoptericola halotolerans]
MRYVRTAATVVVPEVLVPAARTDPATRSLGDLLTPVRATRVVLGPSDVGGPVAWQTLVRDGDVQLLRPDAACPAGTAVGPDERAGLLARQVPSGAVVTGRTAAWVHTGYDDGGVLHLTYRAGRHQPDRPPGSRLWQSPLLRGDTTLLDGVPVTVPHRTVVELVLHDPDPVPVVLDLVHRAGADLRRARRSLELRTRAVGRPRARRLLDAAEASLADRSGPAAGAGSA